MLTAVVGGTGVAGRAVVDEALRRGHHVRVLTRRPDRADTAVPWSVPGPVDAVHADVLTGRGVDAALAGVDVVIDVSNTLSTKALDQQSFFVTGTRRLLEAEAAARVSRHVLLSIVGIDTVPLPYYRAKLSQESAAREGRVPVTVVRATQFHDFAGQYLDRGPKGPVRLVPVMRIQPVAVTEVARVLLDAAEAPRAVDLLQIAGPRVESFVDLARRTLRARGTRALVVPVPLPGAVGRGMRSGALTLPGGPTGGPTAATWLAHLAQRAG